MRTNGFKLLTRQNIVSIVVKEDVAIFLFLLRFRHHSRQTVVGFSTL